MTAGDQATSSHLPCDGRQTSSGWSAQPVEHR